MCEQRRKHERFRTLASANIYCGEDKEVSTRAGIVNISEGGLAFACATMFFPGDKLTFEFLNEGMSIEGTVKRMKENDDHFAYGVEFKDILKNIKELFHA